MKYLPLVAVLVLTSCSDDPDLEGKWEYTNCESGQNGCVFRLVLENDQLVHMENTSFNNWETVFYYEKLGGEWSRVREFTKTYRYPDCMIQVDLESVKQVSDNVMIVENSLYSGGLKLDESTIRMCSESYLRFLFNYLVLVGTNSEEAIRIR